MVQTAAGRPWTFAHRSFLFTLRTSGPRPEHFGPAVGRSIVSDSSYGPPKTGFWPLAGRSRTTLVPLRPSMPP